MQRIVRLFSFRSAQPLGCILVIGHNGLQGIALCQVFQRLFASADESQKIGSNSERNLACFGSCDQYRRIGYVVVGSVVQCDGGGEVDRIGFIVECIGKIESTWHMRHDEGAIVFASDDGGIELRISIEVAKRHAEVAWSGAVDGTPDVIRIGSCCGKSLLPGYICGYMAANNIAFEPVLFGDKFRGDGVFAAEPSEIETVVGVEGRLDQEMIETGGNRIDERADVHDGITGELVILWARPLPDVSVRSLYLVGVAIRKISLRQ